MTDLHAFLASVKGPYRSQLATTVEALDSTIMSSEDELDGAKPILLIERSRFEGREVYLTSHATAGDAAAYHDQGEEPQDWPIERIVDLATDEDVAFETHIDHDTWLRDSEADVMAAANPPERYDPDSGVTYVPWTDGGLVGYRCQRPDGKVEYVYLNPSGGSDDGVATVFLYWGTNGDPAQDAAITHIALGDR